MKKTLIAFLVMAAVGVGAAFILAQGGKREGYNRMSFGGRGFDRVAEKLNLTGEQKTQVETIKGESQTRIKPLMESMRESRRQAENLGTDGTFDEEQITRIANGQSNAMKQLFIEQEKTKAQIFAVLTPEQRTEAVKMKGFFNESIHGGFKKRFGGREEAGTVQE